jgi:lathosterol oxidase
MGIFGILSHILCYDVWYYVSHICLHHKSLYWIHKRHHETHPMNLTYKDAHHTHILETIVQPLGVFVPCFFYKFSTTSVTIAYIIIIIRGATHHDGRFSWLKGNHHILHHRYPCYNYGEYWLDTLFGTRCPIQRQYIYGKLYT